MLQRIQTVYLLLVVALMTTTLFLPLATIQSGSELYSFNATGVNSTGESVELLFPTWSVFALTAIIALLAFVAIFMYKTRIKQMRICIFNTFLMLGFYGLFFFFIYKFKGEIENFSFSVKFALSLPLVSLILNYLAIRNIGADEALVRSLNRLR